MANVEELLIKLTADNKDLKAKLSDSEKSVGNFGGAVSKMGPMIAAAFSVGAVLAFGKASFLAAEEAAKANRRLLFALKNNQSAYKELTSQADLLRDETGVDDEAIKQIQTLGAQAGYSTEKIKKIAEATVNLASVTGQDLQAAYMQINATYNGTAGRLTRLDASFGELTAEELKNGGAVDLLNTKYKDFAKNSASDIDKLKVTWGEFKETVGTVVAPGLNSFFEKLNRDLIITGNNSLTFWEKLTNGREGAEALIKQRREVDENVAAWKKYDIAQSLIGFQDTKEGIDMVNESLKRMGANLIYLGGGKTKLRGLPKPAKSGGGGEAKTEPTTLQEYSGNRIKANQEMLEIINKQNKEHLAQQKKNFTDSITSEAEGIQKLTFMKISMLETWTNENIAADIEFTNLTTDRYQQELSEYQEYLDSKKWSLEQYNVAVDLLEEERKKNNLENISYMLGMAASLFKEHTVAYKALASAEASINTYLAATAAYKAMAGIPVIGPALGAVAAAVAIAAGLANVAKINGVAFAEGGIVSGPTHALVGEYAGAKTNPEVIAPLNKLQSMIGGGQPVEVYGVLRGQDIYLSSRRGESIVTRRG